MKRRMMLLLAGLVLMMIPSLKANAAEPPLSEKIGTNYTGMVRDQDGKRYFLDSGIMARDKEAYDPVSNAWYWFDADGTMAVDKDAFIPTNPDRTEGKWVRYDVNGAMVKGEDWRYGGWYWFDPTTGEMIKGFVLIPVREQAGAYKWVYYDDINGQMHHGESCINGGWYKFDNITGEMLHGEYCSPEGNWYYYDEVTGIMQKGMVTHHGKDYYYDPNSGIMQKGTVYHDGATYYYDEVTGVLNGVWGNRHTHSYTGAVTQEPTCYNTGVKTYTCSCGNAYTEVLGKAGHDYLAFVTQYPTATSDGIQTEVCQDCGYEKDSAFSRYDKKDRYYIIDLGNDEVDVVYGHYEIQMADEVFNRLNAYRGQKGIPALNRADEILQWACDIRANECSYLFSHTRPNGENVLDSFWQFGSCAENIAMGYPTAEAVMTGWMNSDGHNRNMLWDYPSCVAISVFAEANGYGYTYYYVQLFGYE